jgi:hypothetical protein
MTLDAQVALALRDYPEHGGLRVLSADILDGHVEVRFTFRESHPVFRVQLPLPSAGEGLPWLSFLKTPEGVANDMVDFIHEEMDTGAAEWADVRLVNGELEFQLDGPGFKVASWRS